MLSYVQGYRAVAFVVILLAAISTRAATNSTPKLLPSTTNIVEVSPEQRLLQTFPQLQWSRAKLEFHFVKEAQLTSAFGSAKTPEQAGAIGEEQAWKMAKEMEALFKGEPDRRVFTEGWKMTGRINGEVAHFSKKNYTLSEISGELELLYERDKLISLSFWTDGSDTDFTKLYRVLVAACNSPGQREVTSKDDSKIRWAISGSVNRYEVELSHRRWGTASEDLERGMSIDIKHPPFKDTKGGVRKRNP